MKKVDGNIPKYKQYIYTFVADLVTRPRGPKLNLSGWRCIWEQNEHWSLPTRNIVTHSHGPHTMNQSINYTASEMLNK